jgi:L-alanine-DL-glutamate epimerase-like enolase superfamily enzyme
MKIAKIDVIEAVVPFDDGSGTPVHSPGKWTTFDMVLVRLETDTGLVGWGECFAYSCRTAVDAAARDMVAPLVQDRDLSEWPETLTLELQQRLHIFGRYGIAMFAISGFDIALWDLAARSRGVPLHALLGSAREGLTAYASLVRFGDVSLVDKHCRDATATSSCARSIPRSFARDQHQWTRGSTSLRRSSGDSRARRSRSPRAR